MENMEQNYTPDDSYEQILVGGRTAAEIIKIGNTVHRALGPNPEFTHALLKQLENKNFKYAPRFFGIDERGREVLSFIEGEVPHDRVNWSDDQLICIAKIIRQFHDATSGTPLAQDQEVICHNDLAPWNIVLKENNPAAFIDYDEVAPGNRMDDFGYFLWTFLELGSDISADTQAKRIRLLADAYGFDHREGLVDRIYNQQQRILAKRKDLAETAATEEARQFSAERINPIKSEMDWIRNNRAILEQFL